jgi:hypothetical protein
MPALRLSPLDRTVRGSTTPIYGSLSIFRHGHTSLLAETDVFMAGALPVQRHLNCLVSRRDRSICRAVFTVVRDSLFAGANDKFGRCAVATCCGR